MKKLTLALAGLMALGVAGSAGADQYEDAIKYRRAAFSMVKWNFGPMGAMVKGEMPFDKAAFARHADNLAALAKMPLDGFIDGSDLGDTKSKPEVWEQRNEFESKMREFVDAADQLALVAKGGDQGEIKSKFSQTAKTCKSCHDDFKTK